MPGFVKRLRNTLQRLLPNVTTRGKVRTTLQRLFPDVVRRAEVTVALLGLSEREMKILFNDEDEVVLARLEARLGAAMKSGGSAAGATLGRGGASAGLAHGRSGDLVLKELTSGFTALLGQQQQLMEQLQQVMEQEKQLMKQQQENIRGLTLDLFRPMASVHSNRDRRSCRNSAFEFYYGSIPSANPQAAYKCMVTGELCPAQSLVAGHIHRPQWPKSFLAKVGVGLHEPANIIIMQRQLKKAFDRWHWTLVPEGPDEFKVQVLYPPRLLDPMQQYINGDTGRGLRWQDFHGSIVKLSSPKRPSGRLCGFHAMLAVRNAEALGWICKDEVVLPRTAWDSVTPTCDKQLMQQLMNSL